MTSCNGSLRSSGHSILYLHGFNSSPRSLKARIVSAWLADHRPDITLHVPELPYSPSAAIAMLKKIFFGQPGNYPTAVTGSSLGGFYALFLSASFHLKAAVVNPAVKPFNLLQAYLGDNVNLHSGSRYQLTTSHMDELLALQVDPAVFKNAQILTFLQTGDQTLDYREAFLHLSGQPMWIFPEGSHEFENFEQVIPAMINHFGM